LTIFGDRQSSDLEDDVEDLSDQLPSGTLDPISGPRLEGALTEEYDQDVGRTEDDFAQDTSRSQASNRFETLVEAAAECRAERSRSAPSDLGAETIANTTITTSTDGILCVSEFISNSKNSSVHAPIHQALSPSNFRAFGSPKDLSTSRITTISPETAFSLPTTPILSSQEARLMQHFIEHLAPSIDVVCEDSIFGRLVPRMAFLSPILLTSIFAVASKHISKTIGITDPTPETYFQETLDHLIPVLNEPDALVEDYILAAVVILRVMEEMDSE
jgi:hypothetical protein